MGKIGICGLGLGCGCCGKEMMMIWEGIVVVDHEVYWGLAYLPGPCVGAPLDASNEMLVTPLEVVGWGYEMASHSK